MAETVDLDGIRSTLAVATATCKDGAGVWIIAYRDDVSALLAELAALRAGVGTLREACKGLLRTIDPASYSDYTMSEAAEVLAAARTALAATAGLGGKEK